MFRSNAPRPAYWRDSFNSSHCAWRARTSRGSPLPGAPSVGTLGPPAVAYMAVEAAVAATATPAATAAATTAYALCSARSVERASSRLTARSTRDCTVVSWSTAR